MRFYFVLQTSVLANDLATVYDEKGRYNKAERLARKAIKIARETAPANLATYNYNLGAILMHKGKAVFFSQLLHCLYGSFKEFLFIFFRHIWPPAFTW